MSDILRIVTLSRGGRPVPVFTLDDGADFQVIRESFKHTPGPARQQLAESHSRYGGSQPVGETHVNGKLEWTALVSASSGDQLAQRVEQLLSQVEDAGRGRLLEFRPDTMSAARSSFFELRGPGEWQASYEWAAYNGGGFTAVQLSFPVAPLVRWAPMTIGDDFSVDSIADYAFDAGAGTLSVAGGQLVPSSTGAKRLYHAARGYTHADAQVTFKVATGASVASHESFAVIKRVDASNYLIAGPSSTGAIKIYTVVGGVATERGTAALSLSANTPYWLRARIKGNVVTAEVFTVEPTPSGVAAATATATLSGADAAALGSQVSGQQGMRLQPGGTDWRYDDFRVDPYVSHALALPQTIALDDVPGTAPALADVTLTPSGGVSAPVFALLSWARAPDAAAGDPDSGGYPPFGILEAELASELAGWTAAADAGSRGGWRIVDTSVSGAESYVAKWIVDPGQLASDEFTDGELALEVWAVAVLSSGLVSPKLTASLEPLDGPDFGAARYTAEWQSFGKLLTAPSSGTVRRLVRLGVLLASVDRLYPNGGKLCVAGSTAAGSAGTFGIDYLLIAPARTRAASPSGKVLDATYPKFVTSTGETSKIIRHDLTSVVSMPPYAPAVDHGLGGAAIALPPGDAQLLVKLSSLVPDDPTANSSSEQLAHTATVSVAVTPRSYLLRGA